SCYTALARTSSFWPFCRTLRTLRGAAFAVVLGLPSPLLLAPVSTAAAATPGERQSDVFRGGYGQTSTCGCLYEGGPVGIHDGAGRVNRCLGAAAGWASG